MILILLMYIGFSSCASPILLSIHCSNTNWFRRSDTSCFSLVDRAADRVGEQQRRVERDLSCSCSACGSLRFCPVTYTVLHAEHRGVSLEKVGVARAQLIVYACSKMSICSFFGRCTMAMAGLSCLPRWFGMSSCANSLQEVGVVMICFQNLRNR